MLAGLLTIIIGLIGGVSVGLQVPIAGGMSQRIGGLASSFIVHLGGAILAGVLLVARGGENIRDWRTLPWYMFSAGIFGVILYLTLSYTLPRLGGANALILIIAGQLVLGMFIDHFGWFGVEIRPISVARVAALGLLLAGGYLMGR